MEVFLARQPILDRRQKVVAYELLFRSGLDNFFTHHDGEQATADVIHNSLFNFGFDKLVQEKRAFINFPRKILIDEIATLLPHDRIVIEILETVEPDDQLLSVCKSLKRKGYLFALDDFCFQENFRPLISLADIIKVDFLKSDWREREELIRRFGSETTKFLAEKVETIEDFQQGLALGYSYFQGYFFSKPVIVTRHEIVGSQLTYLQILQEIFHPEPDYERIETAIKRDVSCSYNLLKLINSAGFGLRNRIESIKHALVYLGVREIQKWVSLSVLRGIGRDKPDVLFTQSIIRGRMAELLAPYIGLADKAGDLFLMGLFSLMDALLDRPMPEILEELPIAEGIKAALSGEDGVYIKVLRLIMAYEKGNWLWFSQSADELSLHESCIPELYRESLEWADGLML